MCGALISYKTNTVGHILYIVRTVKIGHVKSSFSNYTHRLVSGSLIQISTFMQHGLTGILGQFDNIIDNIPKIDTCIVMQTMTLR